MPRCSFKNCKNHTSKSQKKDGVSYFRFPRDPVRCGQWISVIARQRYEEFFMPTQGSVVCSNHFLESDEYVTNKGIKRLNKTAIPRIETNDEDESSLDKKTKEKCRLNPQNIDPKFTPEKASLLPRKRKIEKRVYLTSSSDSDTENNKNSKKPHHTDNTVCDEIKTERCLDASPNKDSATSEKEIKVFCPTCNTEVSHTAEGIQEDQTKILIAKVYHYFEQEYEEMKKVYEDIDLTPLSKFSQRTALATGVTETTVLQILKEEEERSTAKREGTPQKRRRARKRPRQTNSSSEEDNSDDNNDDGEHSSDDHEVETLAEKVESGDDEEPEIYLESANLKGDTGDGEANKEPADPISVDVKIEPAADETDKTNVTLAINEPADTQRKGRKQLKKTDVTPTQQHSQGDSSTTAASSSVRRAEELYESSLLGDSEVKVEEIEMLEEGFS